MFTLRFPLLELATWAARYPIDEREALIETEVVPRTRAAGWLTREGFLTICRWKSPRMQRLNAANDAAYIQAVSQTALCTDNENLRIEAWTLLRGVSWPTASVMLHWLHQDPYSVLDYRALWSLGCDAPAYDFAFWWSYTETCRKLAEEAQLNMRQVDRALWQYSREHQSGQGSVTASVDRNQSP